VNWALSPAWPPRPRAAPLPLQLGLRRGSPRSWCKAACRAWR
jgi:hypothetical protein